MVTDSHRSAPFCATNLGASVSIVPAFPRSPFLRSRFFKESKWHYERNEEKRPDIHSSRERKSSTKKKTRARHRRSATSASTAASSRLAIRFQKALRS